MNKVPLISILSMDCMLSKINRDGEAFILLKHLRPNRLWRHKEIKAL